MNDILNTYQVIYKKIAVYFAEYSKYIFPLISGFLIVMFSRSIFAIMDTIFIQEEYPLQRIVFILSTALLIVGLEIGYTKFVFSIIDKKSLKLSNIFNYFHLLGRYIVGIILFYVIMILCLIPFFVYLFIKYGNEFFDIIVSSLSDPYFQELASTYFNLDELFLIFLVCSIPAFYIGIRLSFWSYFLLDCEVYGLQCLKKSWFLTSNRFSEIIVFGILLLLFNLIGALLIIGICFTVPIYLSLNNFSSNWFRLTMKNKVSVSHIKPIRCRNFRSKAYHFKLHFLSR